MFSNAPNTARGIISGVHVNALGQDTNKLFYGQIGYLFPKTDGVNGPGLRVLTRPGPGGGTP